MTNEIIWRNTQMKWIAKITPFLLIAALLAGCAPTSSISTPDLQTLVAQTVVALQTQNALQAAFTQTAAPTETSIPTFTSVPTLAPTATPIPPTPTEAEALYVSNVQDVTIPAGTVLKGGQSFVKTWRITNGGTAAWLASYRIVFVSGDSMGVNSITLGKQVNPGATYEVSATFIAPVTAGKHVASFMIETDNGYSFGLGRLAGEPWSIRITSENVFAATGASLSPSVNPYSGTCPATINLVPSITTNGSGTVTYYIKTSAGISDTYSLTFTNTGTQTGTTISWPVDATTGTLTAHIYIDYPNHQDFAAISIPVTCTP
jgi:hypothetical protein